MFFKERKGSWLEKLSAIVEFTTTKIANVWHNTNRYCWTLKGKVFPQPQALLDRLDAIARYNVLNGSVEI